MPLITLVGKRMAKIGDVFVYAGPLPECKECRTKQVCFNLVPGKAYRITALRDKAHGCGVTGDEAVIAELEEASQEVVLPKRLAIEGSTVTFKPPRCRRPSCVNYKRCHPFLVAEGVKLKVLRSKGVADCANGDSMSLVEVG